jgi:hypothetical protein
LNLRKIILGANFTEIVMANDLRVSNGKATIMGWSGRKLYIGILAFGILPGLNISAIHHY